jgi:polyribonucleotide nucleotidyltransferase
MDGDLTLVIAGGAIAAVVGALVMNLFKRPEEDDSEPVTADVLTKSKKEKKKPAAKKAKKAKKAPAPEPESEEEEDVVVVATPPPAEKKKKKKKKGKAAAEPEPEPEVVETAKQKKKREKKEKAAAAEAAAFKAAAAAGQAAPAKKDKKKKKATSPTAEDDGWEMVPQSFKPAKKAEINVDAADKKPQIVFDLGAAKFAVIGRGGAVIKGIQQDTGARIDIAKGGTTCTITGGEESVANAAAAVKQIMAREDAVITEIVDVPGDRIPAIIGKGGSKIKELEVESGANIKVQKETNVVTVRGDSAQVMKAKALIDLVLNPPEIQYETTTTMDLSLLPMGTRSVYVIKGKGGATINGIEKETGAKLDIERGTQILSIKGQQMAVVNALNLVSKVLAENGHTENVPIEKKQIGAILGKAGCNIRAVEEKTGARLTINDEEGACSLMISGTQAAASAARVLITELLEGGPMKPTAGPGEIVVEIVVPDSAIGSIIGRQGATIKEIQSESGANVDIPKGMGVAWVVGKSADVAKAKALIEAKVAAGIQADKDRAARDEQAQKNAVEAAALFAVDSQPAEDWGGASPGEEWGGSSGADGW